MIRSYQERRRIQEKPPVTYDTATIASVSNGRYQLTFPWGSSTKYYQSIDNITHTVGQRVKTQKINGTYIITGTL